MDSHKTLYDDSHDCQIRVVVRFRPLIPSEVAIESQVAESTPRKARTTPSAIPTPPHHDNERTPRRAQVDAKPRTSDAVKGDRTAASTPPSSSKILTTPVSARRKSSIVSADSQISTPPHSTTPLSSHIAAKTDLHVKFDHVDDRNLALEVDSGQGRVQNRDYVFDRIFRPEEEQACIYREVAHPIIDDILEGYNGTIIAYGQTGSGKTFTMLGPDIESDKRGIVPRCCEELFERVHSIPREVEVQISCSYLQIYMESIQDLLNSRKSNLRILEKLHGGVYVEKLTEEVVTNVEEVIEILACGEKNRVYAATNMNEHSSRSHCLFMVKVDQLFPDGSRKRSLLNFVDLAGSERLYKTGVEGLTLEEGKKINLSLTSLSRVIHALSEQTKGHIPYRDSKLTRILQESIGGNAKTSLIVNCSPCKYHVEETISSLGFGQRAKTIKNSVHINQEESAETLHRIVGELKVQIQELKQENELLLSGHGIPHHESVDAYIDQIAELHRKIEQDEMTIASMRRTLEDQREIIVNLKARNKILEETCQSLRHQLAESEQHAEVPISMMEKRVAILEGEVENFRSKYAGAVVEILEKENTITQYKEMLKQTKRLEAQLKQAESSMQDSNASDAHQIKTLESQLAESKKEAEANASRLRQMEAFLKQHGLDFDTHANQSSSTRHFKLPSSADAPISAVAPVPMTRSFQLPLSANRTYPVGEVVNTTPPRETPRGVEVGRSNTQSHTQTTTTGAGGQVLYGTPMVATTVGYMQVPVQRLVPLSQVMGAHAVPHQTQIPTQIQTQISDPLSPRRASVSLSAYYPSRA